MAGRNVACAGQGMLGTLGACERSMLRGTFAPSHSAEGFPASSWSASSATAFRITEVSGLSVSWAEKGPNVEETLFIPP